MEMNPLLVCATVAIVFATTTIIRILFSSSSLPQMKWPSGPRKLPIIGNLHQLGDDVLHVALAKLAKVHGSVMTIWIGSWRPVIVISDIEKAWEVLVNKSADYGARDMPEITKIASASWHTISTSDAGSFWQNVRKGLQSGAMGPLNVAAQNQYQERDMKRLIKAMSDEAANNNGIVKPLDHIKKNTVRLLTRLIFGQAFDDNKFIESMHYEIEDIIRISGYARLAEAFYYAKYLPSHKKAEREAFLVKCRVEELVRPLLSSKPPTNSYLYFLLSQNFEEEVIIFCIFELYLLGVDSTSSTTTWALAYLIREQGAQEKLYQDIRMTLGDVDLVKIEDVNKLKYLQGVVKETMRMKPIAPLAIPHKTAKETTLMGTKVAKGTRIMVNLYALHHNQNIWPDPYKFMPERFLEGETGTAYNKAMEQSFLPFSAGMRICAGMDLGKLQFAFALANLVNAFKWSCVEEGKLPDMGEELSFVLLMKTPLEARIAGRNV
uniref:(S)-canadine synthase n=1 Tax=Coptis japonica TaxID=3442 RepID=C719A_COPJA|nr:RecName: Full=(S)-canadine synthase; AltName: Full=(S)-tetrahydrocolumbamine oxidase (methylenedioxy-bridge-forming); AltName: Full=Cytochrome P450 719A1 [Coptis japonica]ANY58144.1 CYP719A1 [synthetic construct]BAB68769.1 methylenedioxy bridge-forming enzyme [Coptis japonica]